MEPVVFSHALIPRVPRHLFTCDLTGVAHNRLLFLFPDRHRVTLDTFISGSTELALLPFHLKKQKKCYTRMKR